MSARPMTPRTLPIALFLLTLLAAPSLAVFPAPDLGASHEDAGVTAVLGRGPATEPRTRVLEESAGSLRLEFTLPAVAVEPLAGPEGVFQQLFFPGGEAAGRAGEPELPTWTRLLEVPDGARARVRVVARQTEEYRGLRVAPAPPAAEPGWAFRAEAYARVGYGELPLVAAGPSARLRGRSVAPIRFSPVEYDPARSMVRVAHRVEVEITFEDAGGLPAKSGAGAVSVQRTLPATSSFERLYDTAVLPRSADPAAKSDVAALPGMWLLICDSSPEVTLRLSPLVEWRRRKGYPVRLATTAETGSTKEQIKAYIQNAYDTWESPPEFVVLAGDGAGAWSVPTWNETVSSYHGEGDHPYVLLDGEDILADAHVGRLSFSQLSELETIVAKVIGYESQPALDDPEWFTRACLTGDPYASGYSTVQVMQWIKTRLRELSYTQIDTVFDNPFVSQITTSLNRGASIFAYRGIYGMSGWSVGNTLSLANTWELPFCVIITCDTGSFQNGYSRSEAFLRAGTATSPRGGIGCVGSATTGTHTRFNNCYTFGVYDGLLYQQAWEMGAAHTWGKLNLWRNYAYTEYGAVVRFSYWNNLMGDPAAEIWTAAPRSLVVSHPATLPIGSNLLPVEVSSDGVPCKGALVCLYQPGSPGVQVVGRTDANGRAGLAIAGLAPGPAQLTVSRHDHLPFLAEVAVEAGEHVGLASYTIDDDALDGSSGSGDGTLNPGETIELRVELRNFGSLPAAGVAGTLIALDGDVPVPGEAAGYGAIPPGASAWGDRPFRFQVPSRSWHGRTLAFRLRAASGAEIWESALRLPVAAPELAYLQAQYEGAGPDGLLNPGEEAEVSVRLRNDGGVAAGTPQATLFSLGEYVTVTDAAGSYPSIPPGADGENAADRFRVVARADCPSGYAVPMLMMLASADGAVDTVRFALTVGETNSFDPLGPDRYGYWIFDDTDTGYAEAPVFQWREIAPPAGGAGVEVPLGDYNDYQDKSRTVDLPFPFRYYGETYTTATICSNGWITMGATYVTDYRNWMLPSPGGPNGAIAVFWDDLHEVAATGAHVYQYYDPAEHVWIVEWYRLRNTVGSSGTSTFQAIFYDPAWHPTPSGDGIIVFQYGEITNPDYEDGYCTVGIERPDNSDGLTYTYARRYSEACAPLEAGRAFKFTAMRPEAASAGGPPRPGFGLEPGIANPLRPGAELRFSLDVPGQAALRILDLQGRAVRRLVEGRLSAGGRAAVWDGRDDRGRPLPSGIYFARLEAEGKQDRRKLVLMR